MTARAASDTALEGRVALITGGGRGIGAAIAAALAARGARIAITAQNDLPAALATAKAHDGRAYRMDVTDRASVEAAFADMRNELGTPDVVVNNSGTFVAGMLLDLSTEDWDRVFDVHARGFFHVATAAARAMRQARIPGCIVGIAGASALRSYPGGGAYSASKAAVLAAAEQMALEWAPDRIRVNCVLPGPIRPAGEDWRRDPKLVTEAARLPIPRPGTPEEVAEAVSYLATANYVTGQRIVVDGGGTTTWYLHPAVRDISSPGET